MKLYCISISLAFLAFVSTAYSQGRTFGASKLSLDDNNGHFIAIENLNSSLGIGTPSPDGSALVDLTSQSKGFLVPRMTLSQRNSISNPATGLLVFVTPTNELDFNFGPPNAPNWQPLLDPINLGSVFWALGGNASPANNNLGTTTNTDLVIVTNGTPRITINGSTGIATVANGVNFAGANTPLMLNGSAGNSGQVLSSTGAGSTPQWVTVAGGGGGGAVSSFATLIGDGSLGNPLGVNLANVNTWSGAQTFGTITSTGNSTIGSGNSATNSFGTGSSATNTIGSASSTTTFNGSNVFTNAPSIPLAQNNLWVGNASNKQAPFPPGSNGQVLSIVAGAPAWSAAGAGSVTSVGLSMPAGFTVSNSPVTSVGTLTVTTALSGVVHASGGNFSANNVLLGSEVTGLLPVANGGNGTGTYVLGDILYSDAANSLARLSGNSTSTKKFLTETGTGAASAAPVWSIISSGDVPVMVASGASHAPGLAPDPGAAAGATRFLREDATWQVPAGSGTVTSVGLSMPAGFSVSNSPVTTNGILTVTTALSGVVHASGGSFTAGSVVLGSDVSGILPISNGGTGTITYTLGDILYSPGPESLGKLPGNTTAVKQFLTQTGTGAVSAVPVWTTIAATDMPVMLASGASHASGSVPDPGSVAGIVKFLREDGTWQIPAGGASGWSLTGNAGTLATNFVGTTDNTQLDIRTNSTKRLTFSSGIPTTTFLATAGVAPTVALQNPAGTFVSSLIAGAQANDINYVLPTTTATATQVLVATSVVGNSVTLGWTPPGVVSGWGLSGNSGTTAGTNFVGTTDNKAFEIHVFETDGANAGSKRVMRFEPTTNSPNILMGFQGNSTTAGRNGVTISGGGGSGSSNNVTADYGTIGGGFANNVTNQQATIAGGSSDSVAGFGATVGGGTSNTARGSQSVVAGGSGNIANATSSTISGGFNNVAVSVNATVSGGQSNQAQGGASVVAGGASNVANSNFAVISGGQSNIASSNCVVGGGISNQAVGNFSAVFSGQSNYANGTPSVVVGGFNDSATGNYSTCGGGNTNSAAGYGSTIAGGRFNHTDVNFGTDAFIAGGSYANAAHVGQFVQANGDFTNVGDAQGSFYIAKATTNAVGPVGLTLAGFTMDLPANTAWTFEAMIVGRTAANNVAAFNITGTIKRGAGATALVGAVTTVSSNVDAALAGTTATAVANSFELDISVTPAVATLMHWVAKISTVEVTF